MFLPLMLADVNMGFWGQTFGNQDIVIILVLVLLEGVLSIDNALVLGLLAKRVPKPLQKRALTYGLVGAFVFRVIAIATANFLLQWRIVKLFGGGYLVYIAVKHLFFDRHPESESPFPNDPEASTGTLPSANPYSVSRESSPSGDESAKTIGASSAVASGSLSTQSDPVVKADRAFWMAVGVIELTDIAFAVDSILAAIAFIPPLPAGLPPGTINPKLWVVIAGGMIGVLLMRVAAAIFIKLLDRFPRFEVSAYLLVIVIGLKLLVDWAFNSAEHPHRVDFHSYRTPEFWIFWISMIVCLGIGFLPKKSPQVKS